MIPFFNIFYAYHSDNNGVSLRKYYLAYTKIPLFPENKQIPLLFFEYIKNIINY